MLLLERSSDSSQENFGWARKERNDDVVFVPTRLLYERSKALSLLGSKSSNFDNSTSASKTSRLRFEKLREIEEEGDAVNIFLSFLREENKNH